MELSLSNELLLLLGLLLMAAAILIDFRWHRIPNLLCLMFLCIGTISQAISSGWYGFLLAFSGMLLGLLLFIPFYLLKGMSAGDVKLLAAIGALLGPVEIFFAAFYTLIIGGILGLIILMSQIVIRHGYPVAAEFIRNHYHSFLILLNSRIFIKPVYPSENLRQMRFPYAIAIATGTVTVLAQQSLLSFTHLSALIFALGSSGGLL